MGSSSASGLGGEGGKGSGVRTTWLVLGDLLSLELLPLESWASSTHGSEILLVLQLAHTYASSREVIISSQVLYCILEKHGEGLVG